MIYVSHQAGEVQRIATQVVRIEDGRVAGGRRAGAARRSRRTDADVVL